MSTFKLNSILQYNPYSTSITEYNSYNKTTNQTSFNDVLNMASITNVPTGRLSTYTKNNSIQTNNQGINNNCPIHGHSLNNAVNIKNDTNTVDFLKENQTKKAIQIAKSYIGGKYVWGATGPNSFDCSGFTQYIYKKAYGKTIPRVSYEQAKYGEAVKKEDLQPGDLVFFDTMNKGRVSHVGIYIGNNKFIHAANSRAGIIESELKGYYSKKYMGARRP